MATLSITTDCDQQPARLYYLDWLRVIAMLGVFLFHAVHPFDLTAWHIKNAEQSVAVTFFIFSHQAFVYGIRRDWRIHLGDGIGAAAAALAITASTHPSISKRHPAPRWMCCFGS